MRFKKHLALFLTLALLLMAFPVTAAKSLAPAAKAVAIHADQDGDKVFDDLEADVANNTGKQEFNVIVSFSRDISDAELAELQKLYGNFKVKDKFRYIPSVALTLNRNLISKLGNSSLVKQIEPDSEVKATMDTANYWFGTQQARQNWGLTGQGVTIAVIDTGINPNHQDLTGKVIAFKDLVNARATAYDDNGHGTHVSGIAAGKGVNPAYTGVAPSANLVGIKVLNSAGSGSTSTIISGIEWAITNKSAYGIKVINMSLGSTGSSNGQDSLSLEVNQAVSNGIVTCVAAGNSGPGAYTIGSPAAAANAITVGAMADVGEKGFFQASFSSRGPTADGRIKPDVSAPGYNITSADYSNNTGYVTYSGTSMATPFVAGTAALMLQANPSLTPADVKTKLTSTAIHWGNNTGPNNDYGYGRMDGWAAIKSAGGYTTGSNIVTPSHSYVSGSLAGTGQSNYTTVNVTNTSRPLAVTLIVPSASYSKDFDLYVYSPSGSLVGSSETTTRQETVSFMPTTTGTYQIEVYSYSGSGSYFYDQSVN